MKNRKVLLLLVLVLFVSLLSFSVSAAAQSGSGSIFKVNPLYRDHVVQQPLAAGNSTQPDTYYTTEDEVVAAMRAGWEARETTIVVGYQGSANVDTMGNNMLDNILLHTGVPTQGDYLMWHYQTYQLSWDKQSGTSKTIFTCTMTYLSNATQEATMDVEVPKLLNTLNVYSSSDYQKVRAIYDYICENVVYDTAGLNRGDSMVYTAYAALVNDKAVCQGYASLFYRLALELDVDARLIAGLGNGGAHGWNIVQLGNYYYNLDSTWDAELHSNDGQYEYFLKSPSDFDDHERYAEYDTWEFHQSYPMDSQNYDPSTDPGPEQGTTPSNGNWVFYGRNWFYYQNGVAVTGWSWIDGKWYYFKSNGTMFTGWLNDRNTWYYLTDSGAMATGIVDIDGSWHSFNPSGAWLGQVQKNGWMNESGKWYYYQNGARTTGWKLIKGKYYYMDGSGVMQTGWLKIGYIWYYLESSGAMVTGWKQVSGKWYYFNTSGVMVTGWLKLGNTWYYLQPSGAMQTGWLKLGNTWYFLQPNGAMVTGPLRHGSKMYYFSASGACLNP